jgi:serine/threonine-protein kinase
MAELKKLGRYELRRVLGKGAMGVVYEGYDPSLSRRVAVKTILKSVAHDDETERSYAERFVREAKAVARLNHPNIIQVFDFGVENEVAYLVMEFIQGRELRSFFSAGERFEAGESVRIMGELLDALEFAHEAGVIHRDVKPANVMLDGQRRAKLADFGVARVQDSDRSAAGTMVGTPAFMSPEQISGGKVDRRTDIFSAGTILYQLLTGEQPFKGEGAWTVAKQIMQDDPPAPSSVVRSVSPSFDAIVDKALAKNPAQRYASAREFAAALRATVAPAQMSVPPVTPAIPASKPKTAPQTSDAELEFWRAIQNSTDAEEFEFYLEQFPEGTYAGLARHKIARLRKVPDAQDTVRLEAAAQAKQREAAEQTRLREAEEQARQREAEEQARREMMEKALRESAERARREAEERVKREAADRAQRVVEEKAKYEAAEKARREAEENARRAAALARLKQQEEAATRAKAAVVDEDATVGIGSGKEALPPAAQRKQSYTMPVVAVAIVLAGAVGAYLVLGRKPAPAPVEQAPAQAAAPAPAVDVEQIRRETEESLRKEFAGKAAAERAALEKAVAEKLSAERAAAEKVTQAKTAAERASAEKVAAAAAAERIAAEKAAAAKASERANAERAAAERAAAEKAAAERAAADKAVAEKAAAEKAAAEKATAERQAAEKQAAAASSENLLERFVQRKGRDKVLNQEPPIVRGVSTSMTSTMLYAPGTVLFVNDSSCGSGAIKEITIENPIRNAERSYRCISLADDKPMAVKPGPARSAAAPSPAAPVVAAPAVAAEGDALERFIQRKGRHKVLNQEPPNIYGAMQHGEVVYVNDGRCGLGLIREVTGGSTSFSGARPSVRQSRCISLTD